MSEIKRFIIDVGEPQYENAFFEYDEHFDDYDFVCWEDDFDEILKKFNELSDEKEELKQRNKRQYNQLTELWSLIENKDWETLTAMNEQMKEDEKALQREWECYK